MTRSLRACLLVAVGLLVAAPDALAQRRDGRDDRGAADRTAERPTRRAPAQPAWSEVLVAAAEADVPDVLRRHGGQRRTSGLGVHVVKPPRGRLKSEWLDALRGDAAVVGVEPNRDAIHPACRQMGIDILDFEPRSDLRHQLALARLGDNAGLAADGVTVAIVDSGVAPVEGVEEALLPAIDVVGPGHQGRARALGRGGSSSAGSRGRNGERDDHGHGTALASLVVELAPGARILPVIVVDGDCIGTSYEVALGIVLAVEAGADVINVSLSSPEPSSILANAIAHAEASGVLVVAAGGNDGQVEYPAGFPGVLAVTAVDHEDWPASFAAIGPRIDLAAPGVEVIGRGPDETWLSLTGTSPSAALVSATAALVTALDPDADIGARRQAVRQAVRPPVHPTLHDEIGAGVLDLTRLQP